jgi:hypothetical protein
MANLAADLLALGEPKQARELDEQALAMRQRLYGADTDHAHIAWSLTMLAADLRALGEFERAQDLDERALAMRARLANTASR